jgi:hypothetical protein
VNIGPPRGALSSRYAPSSKASSAPLSEDMLSMPWEGLNNPGEEERTLGLLPIPRGCMPAPKAPVLMRGTSIRQPKLPALWQWVFTRSAQRFHQTCLTHMASLFCWRPWTLMSRFRRFGPFQGSPGLNAPSPSRIAWQVDRRVVKADLTRRSALMQSKLVSGISPSGASIRCFRRVDRSADIASVSKNRAQSSIPGPPPPIPPNGAPGPRRSKGVLPS